MIVFEMRIGGPKPEIFEKPVSGDELLGRYPERGSLVVLFSPKALFAGKRLLATGHTPKT